MKSNQATAPDDIPTDVWKLLGDGGSVWLETPFNKIVAEGWTPDVWQTSVTVPMWKGKGDVAECTSYRPVRLLCPTIKCGPRIEDGSIRVDGTELNKVDCFKYLGSKVTSTGDIDQEGRAHVNAAWMEWKMATGVLCDKKVLIVAFCLEDYENALNFALAADTHFKLTPRPKSKTVGEKDDEYVNKIIEIAIDAYKNVKNSEGRTDARLEALINRIFQRNLDKCLVKLNRPEDIGKLLDRLMLRENGDLIAYQIAFDLYENASQQFNTQVLNAYANQHQSSVPPSQVEKTDAPSADGTTEPKEGTAAKVEVEMKDCVRTATAHNATLMANGLMHLGTTCDDFLRDNLDWISKATNWNKFNAVATLGLIHKGHESAAMKLLEPYLPKSEADQFGFKEGGSLFALGEYIQRS
ncbi:hypothetical protein NECAME_10382 [Necator americanus]|uniref:26S proteasome non-ATPase regulatory subunit 1/RPN2 N-terminal domain-containing protein n=1 Tax=Necator americanus TaxID=51031 RepID=W2T8R0_NECAM|nr:hypothetical protein NECAME_10382 [Necator americanus]ETN78385.1 hypothetical protein NECAME_10382 [Necator americanus]